MICAEAEETTVTNKIAAIRRDIANLRLQPGPANLSPRRLHLLEKSGKPAFQLVLCYPVDGNGFARLCVSANDRKVRLTHSERTGQEFYDGGVGFPPLGRCADLELDRVPQPPDDSIS